MTNANADYESLDLYGADFKQKKYGEFYGFVDTYSVNEITGWIVNKNLEIKVVELYLFINGKLRKIINADKYREDLKRENIGDGSGCYSYAINLNDYKKYYIQQINLIEIKTIDGFNLLNQPIGIPINTKLLINEINNSSNIISIYTITFFDLAGETYYSGGAERYINDLIIIFKKKGFTCRVIQCSNNGFWQRQYNGTEIIGIPWDQQSLLSASQNFGNHHIDSSLTIFSPFVLASSFCPQNSIGISHGIYWDLFRNCYHDGENEILIKSSVKHLKKLISVDSATLNFIRSVYPESLQEKKPVVITNYVDSNIFNINNVRKLKNENYVLNEIYKLKKEGYEVFLYPRRLYAARGLDILINAALSFLPIYEKTIILFVGRGEATDLNKVLELSSKFKNRVFLTWLDADDMVHAYKVADYVLIPTMHSEGTSLSCIEALYCGKCVIATHIGGLPELIINKFNGLLIAPDSKELFEAMSLVVSNKNLKSLLEKNARISVNQLTKNDWEKEWLKVIDDFNLNKSHIKYEDINLDENITVLHPAVPGICYEEMKQRPQAIMHSIALAGIRTSFSEYNINKKNNYKEFNNNHNNNEYHNNFELISNKSELYSDNIVVYIYYPYTIIDYSNYFISKINSEVDLQIFDKLVNKYNQRLKQNVKIFPKNKVIFWFDYLDRSDIHPDDDARALIELALKYSDLVTTSSLVLKNEILKKNKKNIEYVSNALSVEWEKYCDLQFNLKNDQIALLKAIMNIEYSDLIIDWRSSGYIIGVYWGAIADWTDLDFIKNYNNKVRYVIIGPIANDSLKASLLDSKTSIYLETLNPDKLALLSSIIDFGVIPFIKSPMTDAVNPLKLWEYIGLNLPVVATFTKEIDLQVSQLNADIRAQVLLIKTGVDWNSKIPSWYSKIKKINFNPYLKRISNDFNIIFSKLSILTNRKINYQIGLNDLKRSIEISQIKFPELKTLSFYSNKEYCLTYDVNANDLSRVNYKWKVPLPKNFKFKSAYIKLAVPSQNIHLFPFVFFLKVISNQSDLLVSNFRPNIIGITDCLIESSDIDSDKAIDCIELSMCFDSDSKINNSKLEQYKIGGYIRFIDFNITLFTH